MSGKNFANYHLAVIVSAWLTTLLTLWTELDPGFKKFLVSIFSHHWIAKLVIISVVFFALALFIPIKSNKSFGEWAKKTMWSVILSFAIIFLFYLWLFLG